jgi:hypothetical protein
MINTLLKRMSLSIQIMRIKTAKASRYTASELLRKVKRPTTWLLAQIITPLHSSLKMTILREFKGMCRWSLSKLMFNGPMKSISAKTLFTGLVLQISEMTLSSVLSTSRLMKNLISAMSISSSQEAALKQRYKEKIPRPY